MLVKSDTVVPHNKERFWTFTFGIGHPLFAGMYVVIYGTHQSARDTMLETFGTNWASQYSSQAEAGVDKHNLIQIQTNLSIQPEND